MTTALEGGEWSAPRPGRTLPPEKTQYPLYRRLGGPQGQSGRVENLFPTGIRSRTARPVVSRYTDWATRPTVMTYKSGKCTNEYLIKMELMISFIVQISVKIYILNMLATNKKQCVGEGVPVLWLSWLLD